MKVRVALALAGVIVAGLVRCTSLPCPVSEAPCTKTVAVFTSSCGVASFTTTCTPAATCDANACSIPINTAQTCDATIVLGDGTTHGIHVVITEPPAVDAGRCPATCPPQPEVSLTVDGADAGAGIVNFSSATCVASDGGSDASVDVASDVASD